MSSPAAAEVTCLLRAWADGDYEAEERLIPLVYQELRRLARNYMRRENPGGTLQTSALVNEAYLRLVDVTNIDWQSRAHFFAVSAQIMRRILVDAARRRKSSKRDNLELCISLIPDRSSMTVKELVALDDALHALGRIDPRKMSVIELRFFAGLTVEETAHTLKISDQTVRRDWKFAKAWLMRELRSQH